ncbi:YitT family protein [Alteribacter aurantiacus]|uniref:YitT family protein n=1 Tax=Alteribacter aurantiacus TaxID=254410 RepID=UPI0004797C81|nr:YitT family protein [Alteribacter aurantiacus]
MRILYMIIGCAVVSFGVLILQSSEVITGGTAGLALSLSYMIGSSFGLAFILINIPFYILSYLKMGTKFTLSTIFAVTTLSAMTELLQLFPSFHLTPLLGSVIGGLIIGMGLAVLFLNGSSLGGANILSLFLQKKFGLDPGKTMFVFDSLVILTGLFSVGLVRGFYSILSVFMISMIVSMIKGKISITNEPKVPMETPSQAS